MVSVFLGSINAVNTWRAVPHNGTLPGRNIATECMPFPFLSVCVCVCVYVHARACVCDHMGRCHLLLRLLTEGVFVHLSLEDYTGQRGGEGGEGERREEKCELKMLEGRY